MGSFVGAAILPHPPILIEEIGGEERLHAQKTIDAMETISKKIKELQPDTLLIISPHGILFRDAISLVGEEVLEGDFSLFGVPGITMSFPLELEIVKEILQESSAAGIPTVILDKERARGYGESLTLDHGLSVPLYFIQRHVKDVKIVPMTYGLLPSEELYSFGKILRKVIEKSGERVFVLASGDLSHRLNKSDSSFHPMGEVFDEKIKELVEKGDFTGIKDFDKEISEPAGECGLRSFQILAGVLHDVKIYSQVLSYEAPWGVGYLCAILQEEKLHTSLARETIIQWVEKGIRYTPSQKYESLKKEKAACFVTLHKGGELRGCIGTLEPYEENLAEEIISNAISAAENDNRFYPVDKSELPLIHIGVDVLEFPEEIQSEELLDPQKYGVIVKKDFRTGVLLPNIEGIDTVEMQLSIAKDKGGIGDDKDFQMYRFEVKRYEE